MGNMGFYDYRPYVKKVTNNRQIMYECDRGFKLDDDGPPGATCVAGRWSPKQLPRCVAEQHSRGRWARSIRDSDQSQLNEEEDNYLSTSSSNWDVDLLPSEGFRKQRVARSIKSGRAPVGASIRQGSKKTSGKGTRYKNTKHRNRGSDDDDTPLFGQFFSNQFSWILVSSFVNSKVSESKDFCPPLAMDEPHTKMQVVTPGKNASDPFSTGVVLNITCTEGYRLNVGNKSVRCKKGIWKPDHPTCLLSKFNC